MTALSERSRRCSSPLPGRSPSRQKAAERGPGSLGLPRQLRPVRSSDVKRSTLWADGQISECTTADQRQICGSSKSTKLRVLALKIVNEASFCRNFKKVADHEGVLQSLQILQQRDKRPRIIKDRACHRHCPLIATRAVAPPAARIIKAGFGISRIENPRRGRSYSSGA